MKTFNLFNGSVVAGSGPNQTNETQSRHNRVGRITYLCRTFTVLLTFLILGTGQMWATDYYLRYMASMPSGNYDGDTSEKLTQFGSTNRYYCELSLTASTQYGFFIRVDNSDTQCWKANATATTNQEVTLNSYDGQHGNSPDRVSYTTGSAGTYIFTYDVNNNKISVSPKSSQTVKVAWSIASGHDGDWNLETYTQLSQEGSTAKYSADVDITSAAKHYLFVQTDNNRYWKSTAAITAGSYAYVYDYGTDNYGNSGDKLNFTPSATGKYRFTWDHDAKMITYQRLYQVTYNANSGTGTTPESSYHLSGDVVTVAANSGSLSKTNYTFSGWNDNNDGSGTNYEAGSGTFSMPSSNKTLYAKWTQTVTLNANTSNGGSGSNGSATATWNGTALSGISHPSGATGYTCTGYFTTETGGTKVLNADGTYAGENITDYITSNKWSRTSSTTLYAQWSNEYTVTLNDHDATVHGNTSVTATYGSEMPNISVPSKTGYIFGGYWTAEGGTGTKYYNENGTSATTWTIASDTELHAKWTGISYQVAFDANEGTGTMANQDFTYGADATALTTNTYTRSGYYFLGWNTQPDGSGTKYHDGKSVQNLTTTADGIVTLYAQWAKTHTLYFLNLKTSGWQVGGTQAETNRFAYAFISYDDNEMYPLGTWTNNSAQGSRMTESSSITVPNVHNQAEWCWAISGVPEGATIIFSDNTENNKTGDLSGWTAEKPYYCKGNDSWYALDGDNEISKMTLESVHIGSGHFGGSWKYYGIDKHGTGEEDQYAIIWLNKDQTYEYKYSNWYSGASESGQTGTSNIIDGEKTTADYGGFWTLNGSNNVGVRTNAHATGEYKFVYKSGSSPETKVYVPRGVNLTSTSPTSAPAGESVTVSFTADAWADPKTGSDMDNPTYYFEFSTDNTNWRTVATYSEPSSMQANTSYTFEAQSGYFRVKLVNDHGLASYSGSTAFTAYSTKSFYVFNPYNNSSDKWETLHLYTWDSNNGNTTYNGSFPGNDASSCINGNAIVSMGGDWFYITIDERANCFMLVGDETYNAHQTVTCYVNNYVADGKYMIYTESNQNKVVEYQAKGASDYRLKYTPGTGSSRYSPIYNTTLDGTIVTSSMWMDASDGSASLVIERGTGENMWEEVVTYSNGTAGFNGIVPSDHRNQGYVFQMQLNFDSGTPANSSVTDVNVYSGSFYVRTDALDGGWNVYKKADHAMTYTDVASAYDYYLCKWVGSAGTNVKFTVGNDYNPELVASLEGDEVLNGDQKLPQAANVRFAWNSGTNVLSRAYISGSSNAADRFLVLEGDSKMYNENGTALTSAAGGQVTGLGEYEMNFADDLNWIYEANVKAQPGARIKLTANYSGKTQFFYGAEGDRTTETTDLLLGGSGTNLYKMRIVYDFKTNRLIKAFMPEGDITDPLAISADMMIIREHQGTADQITFDDDGALSSVQTVYGAMKFNKSTINDASKSRYERDLFWISFPFDVKLSEAFGFGEYGKHWIIEYYDGKGRAANGFWADSPSNWKFVMPADRKNFTMNAFEGYILALDLDEMTESSNVWDNGVTSVYVYFPSNGNVGDISATNRTVSIDQVGYQCTIGPRFEGGDDRRNKDSYWHCIGVPSFANYSSDLYDIADEGSRTVIDWISSSMPYLYEWTPSTNTLNVTSSATFSFKATWSYLVQYSNSSIYWSQVNTPSPVAARMTETPDKEFQLALMREDEEQDHTYVRLTDDASVTNRFEFNYDLSKEYNAGRGNIWTVTADTVEVAGNSMPKPLQTTVVPVGVKVVANGEYTLSMPEGTNGEDVYLIDNAYGTRTNLGLMPYTVTLTAGTYDSRFVLEFAPIQDSPTSLENDGLSRSDELNDANDDVRKVFVGGRLYIIRDGKVYNAAGQRIE
ncbi:MAG: InlB B-repeat-containing protein [Paludibacteraceae bacterium]|nr:InlB B-repeat-containing protein [Paludibacteraceae bacterium]